MNTTPDETLLALWLDDELQGEELAKVEAWALTQPEQLAARQEVRSWRQTIAAVLPAAEEPPYPDFFNSRIEKAIREQAAAVEPAAVAPAAASFWRSWIFPATAFAGMALAFWVGTKANSPAPGEPTISKSEAPVVFPASYTPDPDVGAVWYKGSGASASVIVLQGVSAIPDTLDFTDTASYQAPDSENDRTATASPEGKAR